MDAYSLTFNRKITISGLPEDKFHSLGDVFYVAIDHDVKQIVVRNMKGNGVLQWFHELGQACTHAHTLARLWGYTVSMENDT